MMTIDVTSRMRSIQRMRRNSLPASADCTSTCTAPRTLPLRLSGMLMRQPRMPSCSGSRWPSRVSSRRAGR
jgi:hypothetical protein